LTFVSEILLRVTYLEEIMGKKIQVFCLFLDRKCLSILKAFYISTFFFFCFLLPLVLFHVCTGEEKQRKIERWKKEKVRLILQKILYKKIFFEKVFFIVED